MTIYNIWSNGGQFIPHQKRFINKHFPNDVKSLKEQSKMPGFFNPGGCMNELLCRLWRECNSNKLKLKRIPILRAEYAKYTIQLVVGYFPELEEINMFRKNLESICERDDKMRLYHITLGYTFKDIPESDEKKIIEEVELLNKLLSGSTFSLCKPNVHYFTSMEHFHPMIMNY